MLHCDITEHTAVHFDKDRAICKKKAFTAGQMTKLKFIIVSRMSIVHVLATWTKLESSKPISGSVNFFYTAPRSTDLQQGVLTTADKINT